jgi:glycine cleavage system pyridoxal-binding protein P
LVQHTHTKQKLHRKIKAILNFQTMVIELMEIANASLLDRNLPLTMALLLMFAQRSKEKQCK